jgi:hypothetical protein
MLRRSSLMSVVCLMAAADAFQPSSRTGLALARSAGSALRAGENADGDEIFQAGDDGYSGDVDWDAEWKKVVTENKAVERPGKDFYKSDVERAAILTTNKVAKQVAKVKVKAPAFQAPSVPTSLQGDWKFWIGILAVLSVGTSLLAGGGPAPMPQGNESFYI